MQSWNATFWPSQGRRPAQRELLSNFLIQEHRLINQVSVWGGARLRGPDDQIIGEIRIHQGDSSFVPLALMEAVRVLAQFGEAPDSEGALVHLFVLSIFQSTCSRFWSNCWKPWNLLKDPEHLHWKFWEAPGPEGCTILNCNLLARSVNRWIRDRRRIA